MGLNFLSNKPVLVTLVGNILVNVDEIISIGQKVAQKNLEFISLISPGLALQPFVYMKEERTPVGLRNSFYNMSVKETHIHAYTLLRSSLIEEKYINASIYNSRQIVYRSTE